MTHLKTVTVLLVALCAGCDHSPETSSLTYFSKGDAHAVLVDGNASIIHTAQLFPTEATGAVVSTETSEQIDQVLANVETALAAAGSNRSDLIKLNVYATSNDAAARVRGRLAGFFASDARPAVSYVVTRLPIEGADVAMDAVAAAPDAARGTSVRYVKIDSLHNPSGGVHVSVMPGGGRLYLSGQTHAGEMLRSTDGVMDALHRTLAHYGTDSSNVFQIKSFLHPMTDADSVAAVIRSHYPAGRVPPLVFVEWVDDSYLDYLSLDPSDGPVPIEIELHAFQQAQGDSSGPAVTYGTPPWMTGPATYSRAAQVHHGDLLYVTGLYGDTTRNAEGQLYQMFGALSDLLDEAGSSFDHLVKATYYVTDSSSSDVLNRIRTEFYNPSTPPTSSKMPVSATGVEGAALTFDMIGVVPSGPAR